MKHFITLWVLFFLCATLGAGFSAICRLGLVLPFVGISGLAALGLCVVLSLIK